MNRVVRQAWLRQACERFLLSLATIFWVWNVIFLSSVGIGEAAILTQTNFENGTTTPWNIFVTPNGTIGGNGFPSLASFETGKNEHKSKGLQFKVGQVAYAPDKESEQGGGLVFEIATEAGTLNLSAHVAVTYLSPKNKRNLAGGLFQWIIDEDVIVSHDFGPIKNGGIIHYHLNTDHLVNAGGHAIRLRITRPFISHPEQDAPYQYVNEVRIGLSPTP